MGKSKGSCFHIMACARGDSTSADALLSPECKASSDKFLWSFRKRLSRHWVLPKSATAEPESVGNNTENIEAITSSFNSTNSLYAAERPSILKKPSKEDSPVEPKLSSIAANSEVCGVSAEAVAVRNGTTTAENFQEYAAIIIQTAIRRYLALRKLSKVKNVIKLQAAVRGHLVRVHAIGTLRCIQAIVKMQAIVRARLANQLQEKLAAVEVEKFEICSNNFYHLGKGNPLKGCRSFYSTKKLLSSRFAQQLLASTQMTKPVHIKCDPSKSDLAWKWLERWMTIITSDIKQENSKSLDHAYKDYGKNSKPVAHEESKDGSANPKSSPSELAVLVVSKLDLNDRSEGNIQSKSAGCLSDSCFSSVEKHDQNQNQIKSQDICMKQQGYVETKEVTKGAVSFSSHILAQSDVTPQQTHAYSSNKTESKISNLKNPTKRESSLPYDTEGQKAAISSRRPFNLAFAAAQSKFEELSSISNHVRSKSSVGSYAQDVVADARTGNDHSHVRKIQTPCFAENFPSDDPIIHVAASECGTEISISSTLDSPDRSEAECGEIILEIGSADKHYNHVNACSNNVFSYASESPEYLQCKSNKPAEGVMYASLSANALDVVPTGEQHMKPTASGVHVQLETAISQQDKPSGEETPRSHTVFLEAYGTPSSEVSVNDKSRNNDGDAPGQKQRPKRSDRKASSRAMSTSVAKSSAVQLSDDSKNAKRQQSFGVIKTDPDEQPRMSNSNNGSLPSYMQATKSAKAKLHGGISPKSSPDLHDKDGHIKKRHSLPIGNGKQDSSPPRQRSTPQAQQNARSNDILAPHHSAERRWQR